MCGVQKKVTFVQMLNMPRPRIDLLQLHYFVAVVDAGSITKASRMCNIAQPALSKRISTLEADLGVQLLHRGAFGVQATDEGMVLYQASQRVLREMSAIHQAVRSSTENPAGDVRLGCQDSLTRLISRPLAKETMQLFPSIRLTASAGQSMELYRSLSKGMLDLALIVYDESIHNVAVQLLLEEELFVVAAPSQFDGRGDEITLDELVRIPFVFPSSTTFASGQMVVNLLGEYGDQIDIVAMVDGEALKALIADGFGCCVLPWSFVQPEIESGEIEFRRIKNVPLLRRIALCSSNDRPQTAATGAVSRLIRNLIEAALNDGSWQHAKLVETLDSAP